MAEAGVQEQGPGVIAPGRNGAERGSAAVARPAVRPASGRAGRVAPAPARWAAERRALARLAAGYPVGLWVVVAAYVLAAAIIPTMAPVSLSDDWTYTRSVEILYQTGRLHILPVAAAQVVFQAYWGGLFALVFGLSFGALRLSTLTISLLGGLALYGLCRELGLSRGRSAFGTAAYLFNPLSFALAYSFMSDAHFTSLMLISLFCYARGLQPVAPRGFWVVLGSLGAALAFLVRPHGLLIPLAVLLYLAVNRRLGWTRASADLLARVWALPLATAGAYYLAMRGVPSQQGLFLSEARAAWFGEAWLLVKRLVFLDLIYGGFFVLPVAVALLIPLLQDGTRSLRYGSRLGWWLVAAWGAILAVGIYVFANNAKSLPPTWMPYIPHFFNRGGPGPGDLRASRPAIAPLWVWIALTFVCAAASLLLAVALCRKVRPRPWGARREGGVAGLLVIAGALQAGGVVPQSLLFRNWVVSLDRYLLPLLPLATAGMLWALKGVRLNLAAGWLLAALMAVFSVAGMRDDLVFHSSVWTMARYANSLGIPNEHLDAGYAWDAYHLWEYSSEMKIPPRTPPQYLNWWTSAYAQATDSAYVVAGRPINGYEVIATLNYSAWLHTTQQTLYLERRHDVPPPGATEGDGRAR